MINTTLVKLQKIWLGASIFTYQKLAKPASRFFRGFFEMKQIRSLIGLSVIIPAISLTLISRSYPVFEVIKESFFTSVTAQSIYDLKTVKSLQKPVEIFRITKEFAFFHPGLDLATDAGTPVLAILPGKVEKVGRSRFGYGNHLIINHGSGIKSLYAHLIKLSVKEGDQINKDTVIGYVGSTGWSTGPHLHLEILEENHKINPKAYFEDYFGEKLANLR